MDKKKVDDLREAMTEDISRGRRPVHSESKRTKKARTDQMRMLLTLATEQEFVTAMRAARLAALFGGAEDLARVPSLDTARSNARDRASRSAGGSSARCWWRRSASFSAA